jgi:hypothetical protein
MPTDSDAADLEYLATLLQTSLSRYVYMYAMLQCVMQESARRTNATILLAALMPPSWTS